MQHFGLSAQAHDRIRTVARTIADLDGAKTITSTHLSEAIQSLAGCDSPKLASFLFRVFLAAIPRSLLRGCSLPHAGSAVVGGCRRSEDVGWHG
jgi:hypothetical protein